MQVACYQAPGVPGMPATTLVVDGHIALDAGLLGILDPLPQIEAIEHVLLTHAHLDHIAGLPMFLDTAYQADGRPPTIHSHPATLAALRAYIFNDQIMPDFLRLSGSMPPFLKLHPVHPDAPFDLGAYRITPFALDHHVPCLGFFLQSPTGTIALATDTRPLPKLDHPLWQAVDWLFLECSFPDEQQSLAEASKHLTVSEFLAWIQKLPARTRVVPIHLKPRHAAAVLAALGEIQHPAIQLPPLHGGQEPWTVHVSRDSVSSR